MTEIALFLVSAFSLGGLVLAITNHTLQGVRAEEHGTPVLHASGEAHAA